MFDLVDGVMGFPAQETVTLNDENRYRVPVTLVCPECSPDEARTWIAGGDLPELERAQRVSFVDIDSGHWPMLTHPEALARRLHEIAADSRQAG